MNTHESSDEIAFFVRGLPCRRPLVLTDKQETQAEICAKEQKLSLSDTWVEQIEQAAKSWIETRLEGPLELTMCFWLPRPSDHFSAEDGVRTIRDDAPKWHITGPSIYSLAQLVISTLSRIHVWRDVCQLCAVYVVKGYSQPIGCQVSIAPIKDNIEVQSAR